MKKYLVGLTFLLAIIICISVPVTVAASITSLTEGKKTESLSDTEAPTRAVEPATEEKVIPSEIKGIKISSVGACSLLLSWEKSANANMYTIYRAVEFPKGHIGEYEKYKSTKATSFRDTGLTPARIYKYRVFGYRINGGSLTQSVPAASSAMTKLRNVAYAKLSDKKTRSMKLTWAKSKAADKFIIYRSDEKSNGSFEAYKKLKEVKAGKRHSIVDNTLSGGTVYKYKVVSQRTEADNSAVSSGKVTKGMTTLSAPAKFRKVKATETAIKLGWKAVVHADKYEIFRDGIKVKTVKSTTYTDRHLASGSLHNYNIRAVRKVANNVREGVFATLKASCKLPANRIEVSISKQTLWLYKKGKVILKTPVITGAPGDRATSIGHHHILSRSSPATLKGSYRGSRWVTRVNYWMGFTYSGQGIHDATWQSAFGGQLYRQGRGSHGCVNTPMAAVRKVYENSYVGMLVIVKN